jgi:6-pyruvoyltetrahydropterin/6-carboxytetrahydropterin synthase
MTIISASRYHDFSAGHRVTGHENKCAHLHGHNYRVHFTVRPRGDLDDLGRVLDFSAINTLLCQWLESHWDHQFLLYALDPWRDALQALDPRGITLTSFNPTAENMAHHLLTVIGPQQLAGSDVILTEVMVEETRKCRASASLPYEFKTGMIL